MYFNILKYFWTQQNEYSLWTESTFDQDPNTNGSGLHSITILGKKTHVRGLWLCRWSDKIFHQVTNTLKQRHTKNVQPLKYIHLSWWYLSDVKSDAINICSSGTVFFRPDLYGSDVLKCPLMTWLKASSSSPLLISDAEREVHLLFPVQARLWRSLSGTWCVRIFTYFKIPT